MSALIFKIKFNAIKSLSCLFFFFTATNLLGQTLNDNWKADLDTSMKEFMQCERSGGNGNPCAKYMGASLNTVYKVNDFYSKDADRYLYVNEISKFLSESSDWTAIGHAYEQKTLETAQKNANSQIATVAVYLHESGVGHMVVILPGELQPSGSWGFNVPNSSSFFSAAPNRSYTNKALSYAFGKNLMKDVVLYSRKY